MIKFGPKYTSSSSVHYVAPADFATIYNTAPLLANGIKGSGQTIAVVGRSDILMSDVQTYRQLFNLPPNDPTFIHAGQDNGIEPGDDGESDLDVEISGGIAPNAHGRFCDWHAHLPGGRHHQLDSSTLLKTTSPTS